MLKQHRLRNQYLWLITLSAVLIYQSMSWVLVLNQTSSITVPHKERKVEKEVLWFSSFLKIVFLTPSMRPKCRYASGAASPCSAPGNTDNMPGLSPIHTRWTDTDDLYHRDEALSNNSVQTTTLLLTLHTYQVTAWSTRCAPALKIRVYPGHSPAGPRFNYPCTRKSPYQLSALSFRPS